MSTELTPELKAALVALAHECNWSVNAHPPEGAILRHAPKHLRGDLRKGLDKLRKLGLAQKHPTGRNTTWNITQTGLTLAHQ